MRRDRDREREREQRDRDKERERDRDKNRRRSRSPHDRDRRMCHGYFTGDTQRRFIAFYQNYTVRQKKGTNFLLCASLLLCLQCFDAVGWAAGRASGL